MQALLSPSERLEYDMRNSPAARSLQQELDAFKPSEAEFRAIYQARAALENSPPGGDAKQTESEVTAALKSALGEDRYGQYLASKETDYRAVAKIAERYGLEAALPAEVLAIRQAAEAQARQFLAAPGLSASQRQAGLQSVRAQAEQALGRSLGEQPLAAYRDSSAEWLDRIARPR
jgi:hypothetical protein